MGGGVANVAPPRAMQEIAWVYSEALQGELCIQNIKELVDVAQGGDEGSEGWTRLSNIEGVSMYMSEVESIVSIKTEAVVNVSPELTWRLVQDPALRAAWDPMVQACEQRVSINDQVSL